MTMRYSEAEPISPEVPVPLTAGNREFFEAAFRATSPKHVPGAILLVGGNDAHALALRRAQAALRFDRFASYWSHAALLVGFGGSVDETAGVEVSLDPESFAAQTAERNGVTPFLLSRYFDEARYPNVALFIPDFGGGAGTARSEIVDAALEPNRERGRFPLWDGLAPWARYAYAPDFAENPLLGSVPIPAAALCEYAYGSAGYDLAPGATSNQTCPEMLWATLKRWVSRVGANETITFRSFRIVRDTLPAPRSPKHALGEEPRILKARRAP
jgi:hypothetical protein